MATFDLEQCLAFVTHQVSKVLADAFNERLKKHGITRAQWIALYYLRREKPMSQRELAQLLGVQDSSLARLIERLEREEWIARQRDTKDKRILLVRLTRKGRRTIDRLLPQGEAMSRAFSAGISDEEMEVFQRVLARLVDNAAS